MRKSKDRESSGSKIRTPARQQSGDQSKADRECPSSAAKTQESYLFVWGDNKSGQLSLPSDRASVVDPLALAMGPLTSISAVACGEAHALLIGSDGHSIYALGDNSCGQLGLPPSKLSMSSTPIQVNLPTDSTHTQTTRVACSKKASFTLLTERVPSGQEASVLYSWGEPSAILGREAGSQGTIARIEFDSKTQLQDLSVGMDHAALVTRNNELYLWGANEKGQLGLGDLHDRMVPTLSCMETSAESRPKAVSCGAKFTFVISDSNEILVSGKLPFAVESPTGEQQQDFIDTFQSIAQFDARVKIAQVETSRFASIVVDPREKGQPRELFFWGQSPLGVFNELTPLNQLFASSYESNTSQEAQPQGQIFDVTAVKNGLNFCVFVDQTSSMTYQVGAENMIDPYIEDALVSLSELRDAQFSGDSPSHSAAASTFACGYNFVIGQSQTPGSIHKSSPLKKVINTTEFSAKRQTQGSASAGNHHHPEVNQFEVEANGVINSETCLQLASPDGSKQSFPQRALYQGSISPSTPTDGASLRSYSGQKSMKHRDLAAALKHMDACQPTGFGQVLMSKSHERTQSAASSDLQKQVHAQLEAQASDKEFNQTGLVSRNLELIKPARITEEELEQSSVSEQQMASQTKNEANKVVVQPEIPIAQEVKEEQEDQCIAKTPRIQMTATKDNAFSTQQKKEKKHTFSPDVSPIDGQLQETLQESRIIDQNWIDNICSYASVEDSSKRQPRQPVHFTTGNPTTATNLFLIEDSGSKMTAALPLQMQSSALSRSPHQSSRARYLPVQVVQQPSLHANGPVNAQVMGGNPLLQSVTAQSAFNTSGYLNMSQHQSMLEKQQHQQTVYETMMKEKLENASLQSQLKESQRQLEKSRKDYAKLLSQVDEDSEENTELRTRVRQQASTISELQIQLQDQETSASKACADKSTLETEVQVLQRQNLQAQAELTKALQKIKLLESQSQKCNSSECRRNLADSEATLSKKSKQIYDLTVKLGCLETENKELKLTMQEKDAIQSSRDDRECLMLEQELDSASAQIQKLSTALQESQAHIQEIESTKQQRCEQYDAATQTRRVAQKANVLQVEASVQTLKPTLKSKALQTQAEDGQDSFPRFSHSEARANERSVIIDLPEAVFETLKTQYEASYSTSQEFTTTKTTIRDLDSENEADVSDAQERPKSTASRNLDEFRSLKASNSKQRQSMELPRVYVQPMAMRHSSSTKNFMTATSAVAENRDSLQEKPRHNFKNNARSQIASAVEPKILGRSGRKSARNFATVRAEQYEFISQSVLQQNFCDTGNRTTRGDPSRLVDKNRSANLIVKPTDGDNSPFLNKNRSMINLDQQSDAQGDDSWQTFKPLTTCPNERYSLQRHQEICQGSAQMSHREGDNSDDQLASRVVCEQQSESQMDIPGQARRAKSNCETGCVPASHQKTRRLRQQRKTEAIVRNSDASICDMVSQRSLGTKSNMTATPRRQTQPLQEQQQKPVATKPSDTITQGRSSLLRQPTPLKKVADGTLGQSLSTPELQQKSKPQGVTQQIMRNLDVQKIAQGRAYLQQAHNQTMNASTTQIAANRNSQGSGTFFALTAAQKRYTLMNQTTRRPTQQVAAKTGTLTARQPLAQAAQTPTQSHLKSVTPRVKSYHGQPGIVQSNAAPMTQRQKTPTDVSQQHASATARRVAYDNRRKLALQSMKAMTKSSKTTPTASSINRQARQAVAQVTLHETQQPVAILPQRSYETSMMTEEPFLNPPQQTLKPEMSVMEDSDMPTLLMSARNPTTSNQQTPIQQQTVPHVAQSTNISILSAHDLEQQHAQKSLIVTTPATTLQKQLDQQQHTYPKRPQEATPSDFSVPAGRKSLASSHSAITLRRSQESNLPAQAPRDKTGQHLEDMKEQLHEIQSKKQSIEREILEYESKLKMINADPETQQVLALALQAQASKKAKQVSHSHRPSVGGYSKDYSSQSNSMIEDVSSGTINVGGAVGDNREAEVTLGGEQRSSQARYEAQASGSSFGVGARQTPRRMTDTQERRKRSAFQTLTNTTAVNMDKSLNSSASFLDVSPKLSSRGGAGGTKAYRDCIYSAPQQPPSRIKAPPTVMPKTHYTNQAIFRR